MRRLPRFNFANGFFLGKLLSGFSQTVGLDLGTANTLAYVPGRGVIFNEPSVVAINRNSRKVLCIGREAKQMVGRTPSHIETIRPLRDGVIADFEVTEAMLAYFLRKIHRGSRFLYPRLVIAIPSGCTEVERRAVISAAQKAGARSAETIEEPMAAALGAGLPVSEPIGNMIVDIGAGTTEIAVISLDGICTHSAIRVAGDEMDEAIIYYLRREHNLAVGENTAEEIKKEIGSAWYLQHELRTEVKGLDLITGLPRTARLVSGEVREVLKGTLRTIAETVREGLENTPPELAGDIVKNGVCLAGGGALLRGIDRFLWTETGIPFYVPKDPMSCVVLGAGKFVEQTSNHRSPRKLLRRWRR